MKIDSEKLYPLGREHFSNTCEDYGRIGSFLFHKGTIHHVSGTYYVLVHNELNDQFRWYYLTKMRFGLGNQKPPEKIGQREIRKLIPANNFPSEKIMEIIEEDEDALEFFILNMEVLNEAYFREDLPKEWF